MEARSLILSSQQYTQVSTYDLLWAAGQGFVGLDHRALHAIVDDPEKSIPDLVRFGLEDHPDARVDLSEDLIQIFRHLRTPRSIPYLLAYLRRNHMDATMPVILAFREIGEPAVAPLLEFYNEVKADEDSDAAFLLGSLGIRDPRILEVLLARLATDPADAAHCLAAYGDPAAIPAMRVALEGITHEWLKTSFQFNLGELEHPAVSTEEDEPFDLWEFYPDETDPCFELLSPAETERFLDSPEADNRFAAVSVLSEETVPNRLWGRLLQMAREDPDVRVRGECWQALMDGWERPDIRKAMWACVEDEAASIEERTGALQSLAARESHDSKVHKWLLDFYGRPAARAVALRSMAVSQDPRFEKQFLDHLEDPDSNICAQAMLGVSLLEIESAAPRLVPYFKDEELRDDALPCYAMCAPSEPTRAGLRRLLKKIDDLAHGLSADESDAVKDALNTRAERYDLEDVFGPDGEPLVDEPVVVTAKVGRNDPCPCGSGKKYKKCCGGGA